MMKLDEAIRHAEEKAEEHEQLAEWLKELKRVREQPWLKELKRLREAQRPHGEWIEVPKYKGFYVCSKCLERLDGDFERFDHWKMKKDNFCSVCGSDNRKMGDTNDQL